MSMFTRTLCADVYVSFNFFTVVSYDHKSIIRFAIDAIILIF
jgi:hypothetical protein